MQAANAQADKLRQALREAQEARADSDLRKQKSTSLPTQGPLVFLMNFFQNDIICRYLFLPSPQHNF